MEDAIKAITNVDFISALTLTILLIILGIFLYKKNYFNEESKKCVTNIIMKISLPCLAFSSFMIDFNTSLLIQSAWIIVITFIAYFILLLIGKLIFIKYPKEQSKIYSILMSIGQITLFGLPLVNALYSDMGVFTANMMSIPFRIMVYLYSFTIISGSKLDLKSLKSTLKTIFLNPIIISMFVALLFWISQPIMFKVTINDVKYSILRIDQTLPWLYKALSTIGKLTTPLSMLLIGLTLGKIEFKKSFQSLLCWIIAIFKGLITPFIIGLIIALFKFGFKIELSKEIISSMIICFAAPVSAIVNTFCIKYNKESIVSSDSCFLSTLVLMVDIPFLIMIIELIF